MATAADDIGSQKDCNKCDDNFYRIIIIGAGIAGISAASHLHSNGEKDFIVLEARNRLGGRIASIPMGGTQIELGARWIHGVLDNPVYELALKNGLVTVNTEQEIHTVVATTEEGKRIPISTLEEVYSAYFWFCKRCEEYFVLRTDPPSEASNSVGKHLEIDIALYLEQFQDYEKQVRQMIFDHLLNREACITGCNSMHETGLSDFGSYTELPGGNVTIPTGYSSIIDCLFEVMPLDRILINHVVKSVNWGTGGKCDNCENPSCESDRSRVSVLCENGKIFYSQHVIVTLPLGVLKATAGSMFHPPLPEYKMECIERLNFSAVNKIFLEYDRPFLNPDITEVITLWNHESEPSRSISETWHHKIYSFSKEGDNVLVAWLSGKEAEYLECLSSDDIAETCTAALRKFLNDPYVPKPCRVVCTSWSNEPYTCGSYTSIGLRSSQRDIELLGNAIYLDPYHNKPVLLFAGEATHPNFYSTVHGAFLSGQKSAKLLLEIENSDDTADQQAALNAGSRSSVGDLSSWLKGIDLD